MKKLLILDIDQTLIHAHERRSSNKIHNFVIEMRGRNEFYVFKRRGLDNFIANIMQLKSPNFKIAIWTAAEKTYAVKILDNIWPGWQNDILFLRHRSHCSLLPDGSYVKDLTTIPGGTIYDIMLVDDNIENFTFNTKLGFSVWKSSPYVAGSIDSELSDVYNFLKLFTKKKFPLRPKQQIIRRPKTNSNQLYSLKPIPKKKN